jgi:uncharacterized protein DUF2442
MSVDVVAVKALGKMRLRVKFENGVEGNVDLGRWLPKVGVFRPLARSSYFRRVRVNPETGTIEWPNQADVDPLVLYHWTTGKPLPNWAGPLEDGCPSCTRRIERARAVRKTTPRNRRPARAHAGARRARSR